MSDAAPPAVRSALISAFVAVALTMTALVAPGPATAGAGDPVIAAAGDIACDPADPKFAGGSGSGKKCRAMATSDLLLDIASNRLDRVLAVGDTQYECGALSAFHASYDASWGRVKSITSPIPGDEEYVTGSGCGGATASGYFDYFGGAAGDRSKGYYGFNVPAGCTPASPVCWHVVALNTNDGCTRVPCGKTSAQVNWLRNDLDAHLDSCTIVMWHTPRWRSHTTSSDGPFTNKLPQHIWTAAAQHGADVTLHGNQHFYERFAPQNASGASSSTGTRAFIVGTGGKSTGTPRFAAPNSQFRSSAMGVLKLTLHDGSYGWAFIDRFGSTIDAGSDTCRNPG